MTTSSGLAITHGKGRVEAEQILNSPAFRKTKKNELVLMARAGWKRAGEQLPTQEPYEEGKITAQLDVSSQAIIEIREEF